MGGEFLADPNFRNQFGDRKHKKRQGQGLENTGNFNRFICGVNPDEFVFV